MAGDWIIDVLNDLKVYAGRNGLEATAAILDDACLIAMAELAEPAVEGAMVARRHESGTRKPYLVSARRSHA